jgi:folate-binding protein YgfZ
MEAHTLSDGKRVRLENRSLLRISGPQTREFLQGLITNDVAKVTDRQSIYAALLTPQGKFLFDFFILSDGEDLILDCDAEASAGLLKRLTMYKLRADVTLGQLETPWAVWAEIGPSALIAHRFEASPGATKRENGQILFVDPRHAGLGVRIVSSGGKIDASGTIADYDTWRLTLGIPEGGKDILPDKSFLLECNVEEMNGVDFKKGCYVGQETTARTKHRGNIRKRVLPLDLNGPVPETGTPITANGRDIGTVTSGRGTRALALVRLDRWAEAQEADHAPLVNGDPVTVRTPDWVSL